MIKLCPICHKEFIRTKKHRKYCSEKCYKKFRKKYSDNYNKSIKMKLCQKNYYERNQEKILEYREFHKKESQEYMRKYYLLNKEKISKQKKNYMKEYRRTHKDKIRNYWRNRRRNNINIKILYNLRNRVYCAIERNAKSMSTIELVGCSIDKLKHHLEKHFKLGMYWANYGKWHIDHIRPCVSFDLSKPSEQRKCFHYTNLQPLWASENQSKGSKI